MPVLFVLLNHTLTVQQEKEATESLAAGKIVLPPDSLKKLWAGIPAQGELDIVLLGQFTDWLEKNAKKGDMVLVQGEFGASFYVADFCFQNGLLPIYAATPRQSCEKARGKDGSVERSSSFATRVFGDINGGQNKYTESEGGAFMIEQGLIMQVPFFSTTEEKGRFLVVLGAVTARFISLSKGAELLNLERGSFLELLTAMNVPFSCLNASDVVAERSW